MLLKVSVDMEINTYYAFEQCSKIQIMSKLGLYTRVGCFIRVYQPFLSVLY